MPSYNKNVDLAIFGTNGDQIKIACMQTSKDFTLTELIKQIHDSRPISANGEIFLMFKLGISMQEFQPVTESSAKQTIDNLHRLLEAQKAMSEPKANNDPLKLTSSDDRHRSITFKICSKPRSLTNFTIIDVQPSITLGELKKKLLDVVKDKKARDLYVRRDDTWDLFETTIDDVRLEELGLGPNSWLSFESSNMFVLGACGILNMGNTCFMNSAFQCLNNIPEFQDKVLSHNHASNSSIILKYQELIKNMWSGEKETLSPSNFVSDIQGNLRKFSTYRQHDAHEFMCCFLELLHQELGGEQTFINQLFDGKIQSTVNCHGRCKLSDSHTNTIRFLPIPIDNRNTCRFLFVKRSGEVKSISLSTQSENVGSFIQNFINEEGINLNSKNIQAVRLERNEISETYESSYTLRNSRKSNLAMIEVPDKTVDQRHIQLVFHDLNTNRPFRPPVFVIGPNYCCRYEDFIDQIDEIRNRLFQSISREAPQCELFWMNLNKTILPLKNETSSSAYLSLLDKIILKVENSWITEYQAKFESMFSSCTPTLNGLLDDFFSNEMLNGDYHCSKCGNFQKADQKTDLLEPLPKVLIIQLKRFNFDIHDHEKINTHIEFPARGLNMDRFLLNRSSSRRSSIYDLVAVMNHRGSLTCGHYYTFAKNRHNHRWYSFDDDRVKQLENEGMLVTENAYVLVYVQRK